jgi:hypothetical protein
MVNNELKVQKQETSDLNYGTILELGTENTT